MLSARDLMVNFNEMSGKNMSLCRWHFGEPESESRTRAEWRIKVAKGFVIHVTSHKKGGPWTTIEYSDQLDRSRDYACNVVNRFVDAHFNLTVLETMHESTRGI